MRSVCVIPFVERPLRVLLLRRVPKRAAGWQPVSGRLEVDDPSLEAACLREIFEETGMGAPMDLIDLKQESRFVGYDGVSYLQRAFAARYPGEQEVTHSEEHEEARWVDADEAAEMLEWDDDRSALARLRERLDLP